MNSSTTLSTDTSIIVVPCNTYWFSTSYLYNTSLLCIDVTYFGIFWCRHILAILAQMASFILDSSIFATCCYVAKNKHKSLLWCLCLSVKSIQGK